MADFGTLIARDQTRDVEFFSSTDYDHPVEPTSDFGDQHAASPKGPNGLGDGYYLQEPITGQHALRGAPNGQAFVSGQLLAQYSLAAAAVGGSTVVGTISKQPLAPLPIAGQSALSAPKLGLLGAYRAAVLADTPSLFLHLSEPGSPTVFYNDTSLGGGAVATATGSDPILQVNNSLVQSAPVGAVSATNFAWVQADASSVTPTLPYSVEFWIKQPAPNAQHQYIAHAESAPLGGNYNHNAVNFSIMLDTSGRVQVERGTFYFTNPPGYILLTGATNVADNRPHQIVVTYSTATPKGRLNIYVDGRLDATAEAASPRENDTVAATWGIAPRVGSSARVIQVDEFSYYTYPLTSERVSAHFASAYFDPPLAGSAAGVAQVAAPGGLSMKIGLTALASGKAAIGKLAQTLISFDNDTLPAGTTWSHQPTFVTRSDPVKGTAKALRQADLGDSTTAWTDIPIEWAGSTQDPLTVRYLVDSEANYDYFRLFLDGQLKLSASGAGQLQGYDITGISPGSHVVRIQYSKDGSVSNGFDNVDITNLSWSSIQGPDLRLNYMGDLVLEGSADGLSSLAADLEVRRIVYIEGAAAGLSTTSSDLIVTFIRLESDGRPKRTRRAFS